MVGHKALFALALRRRLNEPGHHAGRPVDPVFEDWMPAWRRFEPIAPPATGSARLER